MRRLSLRVAVFVGFTIFISSASPAPAFQADEAAELGREQKVMQRYLSLLKRTPRFGTALDRVYGHHVEHGTLDEFVQGYYDKTKADPGDGLSWMLLGLIETQRGHDAEAAKAFREAEQNRTDDPLASYYLGRSMVMIGQPEKASEAFERAVERKPQRNDLLEIFQALGRSYQRAQKIDEALKVWDRLETMFPEDLRVQEQIATILEDEGDHEGALKRFAALATKADDRYRQVQYGIKAGELKIRLGKQKDAVSDFEKMLSQLKPDSWLHRDVRERVENVFLRADDYDGLAKYYEDWLTRHPDDIDAMSRLGRTLSFQGRAPEAEEWYGKAIKLAPTDKRLRKSLIDQLIVAGRYADAVKQCEDLDGIDPNNPDNIQRWGELILNDKTTPKEKREANAGKVWRKLLADKSDDPVTTSHVADMFRQAKMTEEAIQLYEKAIELAPAEPQYREYLGEYFHVLERVDDAKNTWKEIAAGTKRNTKNLVRLAEVYHGFGYREDAVKTMGDACSIDPEFTDRVRYAQMLRETENFDDGLKQLDISRELAETDEEREIVLSERIKNFKESGTLRDQIARLNGELTGGKDVTADRWRRLALYYEADSQLDPASKAVQAALKADSESIAVWSLAAKIYETSGNLGEATTANRKLATIDRRYRTEYLQKIASLEMRLGRVEESLAAARDMITSAPDNPEHYRFFAGLCFQAGQGEAGLDALRRAVRVNPSDPSALLTLASALGEQFRTDEAIELYWRAFDKADDVDSRVGIVTSLSELYLRTNHFDRMVAKLERMGKELNQERDMTLCLSAAHKAAGDLGTARMVLEQLIGEDTRDTQLLTQLSQLAEQENDFEVASQFQKRVNEIAPGRDGVVRLANLLLRSGEIDEAEVLWTELVEQEREPHRIYRAIDSLMSHDKTETALKITRRMLRENPQDWEAIFRQAVVLWKLDQKDEAAKRFEQILTLKVDQDEKSAQMKHAQKQAKSRRSGISSSARVVSRSSYPPVMQRGQAVRQVNQLLGISDGRSYYPGRSVTQVWSPSDFGQARVAAIRGLYARAMDSDKGDEFVAAYEERADAETGSEMTAHWDLYFLNMMSSDGSTNYKQQYERARDLSKSGDPAAMVIYLGSLRLRGYAPGMNYSNELWKSYPPLPKEEMDHVLHCFRTLSAKHPEWINYAGGLQGVIGELTLSKREDEAEGLYKSMMESANDTSAISNAMTLAASRGNIDDTLKLAERLQARRSTSGSRNSNVYSTQAYFQLSVALAAKKEHKAIRSLLSKHLTSLRERRASAPSYRRYQSSGSSSNNSYVQVFLPNGRTTHQRLTYPAPNAFFDMGSIGLLHQVYQLHKRDGVLPDLFTSLTEAAAEQSQDDAIFTRLALAYVRWWEEEKDEAARQLRLAQELQPNEPELRLELAVLEQQLGDNDRALELVDGMEPSNHNVLKRREILALQLAVLSGNIERARKAAERLFGLRLDTNTQMQLAAQMHQLGMHEMAEGVLARARRRAGNQTTTLLSLMQQYQSQGNSEVAVQIAHRILRRVQPQQLRPGYSNNETRARDQAMQVLVRSGQIKTLIERVEAQLERSPKSTRLHEILANYYTAAGEKEKAKEIISKIASLRPDDPKFLYQLGKQLASSGDHDGACDNYLAAFKKDASLLGNDYYNIRRTFEQAKRKPEFAKLFATVDLKKLSRHYYRVVDVAGDLMRKDETREEGLEIFRRAWKAFPSRRAYLIGNINVEAVWKLDEMFEYAREGLIPTSNRNMADPWQGIADSLTYHGDGKVTGTLTRIMKALAEGDRLGRFTADVAKGVEDFPEWKGGQAMLAVLEAKAGNLEDARKRIAGLMAKKESAMPGRQGIVIGQELSAYDELNDLTLKVYEAAVKSNDNSGMDEFSYSPARRLANLYGKVGRKDDARKVIYDLLATQDYESQNQYNPGYGEYQELNDLHAAAQEMLSMKLPVDAMRLYNQAMADPSKFERAQRWGGTYIKQQIDSGYKTAKKAITPKAMELALRDWLKPGLPPAESETTPADAKAADSSSPKKKNSPVVDMVLMVQPRSLNEATMTSMFETAVEMAAGSNAKKDILAEVTEQVDVLREQNEDDLSVLVADVVIAFGRKETAERQLASVKRLSDFLEAHPLPEVNGDKSAAAEAKIEAATMLPLWIAARLALKNESTRDLGNQIADRAVTAAGLNSDPIWLLSILRERGKMAIEAGELKSAEQDWSQMLSRILGSTPSATTLDKSMQALELSLLAAQNGMHELSLRAVRDALGAGPPIDPIKIQSGSISTSSLPAKNDASRQRLNGIRRQLIKLGGQWRRDNVDPKLAYETFASVVFPKARPGEVFLYEGLPDTSATAKSETLSRLLIRSAAQAKMRDDLLKRLESRREQPRAVWPVDVMLADIALNDGDYAAAAKPLERISKRLAGVSLQTWSDLALSVAMPGLQHKETTLASMSIVERAAENISGSNYSRACELMMSCARAAFKGNDDKNADRLLKRYLDIKQTDHNRYSGDTGVTRQQTERAKIATIYSTHGKLEQSLELLGQYFNGAIGRSGSANLSSDLGLSFIRMLQQLPTEERYQVLFDWSLPRKGINTVRILATPVTEDRPPVEFARSLGKSVDTDPFAVPLPGLSPTVADTASLLVESARELGKLDSLRESLRKLSETDPPPENIHLMLLRADIEAEDAEGIAAGLARVNDGLANIQKNKSARNVSLWPHFAVSRIANGLEGTKTALSGINRKLVTLGKNQTNSQLIGYIRRDETEAVAKTNRVDARATLTNPGLKYWHSVSQRTASRLSSGAAQSVWLAVDGYVNRRSGAYHEMLFYRYPLTGKFDITFDVWSSGYAEGHVSFGGLVTEAWPWNRYGTVYAWGSHGSKRTQVPFATNERFNEFRISVDGETVRSFINGHLIHTDEGDWSTSPWAAFNASEEQNTMIRNVRITGTPTIPEKLELVKGDGLRGWVANFYGESIPDQLNLQKKPDVTDPKSASNGVTKTANTDWRASNGELIGRRVLSADDSQQSRIYYGRPLQRGETVQYQFFYKPGQTIVHPALDRLAFLLNPDGVRLHWMTTGPDDWTGLTEDNSIEVVANRRGPGELPLKANQWNSVGVQIRPITDGDGDEVRLMLNGEQIYVHPIESLNQRLFGFFRYSNRSDSRIRNVVLTGYHWPKEFTGELASGIMNLKPPKSLRIAHYRMRQTAITEKMFAKDAWRIWLEARELPPEERYSNLVNWVLPSESHNSLRLYADFIPSSLSPPALERLKVTSDQEGQLVSPAVLLVSTAKELGRIDELYQTVEEFKFLSNKGNKHAQQALLGIINLARDKDAEAVKQIEGLFAHEKTLVKGAPENNRWPTLLAVSEAVRHGIHTRPCEQMLRHVVVVTKASLRESFERHLQHLRGRIAVALDESFKDINYGERLNVPHWQAVVQSTARREAAGMPADHWQLVDGKLRHFPGHDHDLLYFGIPLRGNFELNADVSGWREIQVSYGSKLMSLDWNRSGISESDLGRNLKHVKFDPPMKDIKFEFRYRLVMKDGNYQAFVNDRKVFEKKLTEKPDPWLALHQPAVFQGALRNLTITGDITVPEEISLSDRGDLAGWIADYYSEASGRYGVTWKKQNKEIRGSKGGIADSGRQSLLRYHRPMLEDGEIEYEFFYRPNEIHVHPALGRLTFLIQPDGVKVHWLTDGMYDRTGIAHDNEFDEPQHRLSAGPVPLKPNSWNKAALSIAGRTATLKINGEPVFRRELNEGNQREFGLFHFADETESRVRNVIHRGDWPQQLPGNSDGSLLKIGQLNP